MWVIKTNRTTAKEDSVIQWFCLLFHKKKRKDFFYIIHALYSNVIKLSGRKYCSTVSGNVCVKDMETKTVQNARHFMIVASVCHKITTVTSLAHTRTNVFSHCFQTLIYTENALLNGSRSKFYDIFAYKLFVKIL